MADRDRSRESFSGGLYGSAPRQQFGSRPAEPVAEPVAETLPVTAAVPSHIVNMVAAVRSEVQAAAEESKRLFDLLNRRGGLAGEADLARVISVRLATVDGHVRALSAENA